MLLTWACASGCHRADRPERAGGRIEDVRALPASVVLEDTIAGLASADEQDAAVRQPGRHVAGPVDDGTSRRDECPVPARRGWRDLGRPERIEDLGARARDQNASIRETDRGRRARPTPLLHA